MNTKELFSLSLLSFPFSVFLQCFKVNIIGLYDRIVFFWVLQLYPLTELLLLLSLLSHFPFFPFVIRWIILLSLFLLPFSVSLSLSISFNRI